MPGAILYVTIDGVLEPLGYSQVCRVLFGLAKRGFRYELLSMEKPASLADTARVSQLKTELREHDITWTYQAYDQGGGARSAAVNLLRLGGSLGNRLRRGGIALVHARAYHSTLMAMAAKRLTAVPYLFDARGRWVDERIAGGRWFNRPSVAMAARSVERQLYRGATGLVTLTQLHADDIAAGDFGDYTGAPIRVITTCADFDDFSLEARFHPPVPGAIPAEVAASLVNKLVVGFVGSTNASYRHEEAFALAGHILSRRADAHLLVLSAQKAEFSRLAALAGLPNDRVTVTTASHRAMPAWLARIDWSVQLLNDGVAKRGSMPTKLAEFFAAGVRPLHFGCNAEVTSWVERSESGYVLSSLEPSALAAAADYVAQASRSRGMLERARERAAPHFDLKNGLDAYDGLLSRLLRR